jgi:tRNA (guanine37-N1)-methyltransferase
MRFDVVSVFPEIFAPVFEAGVVGRAIKRGLLDLEVHDLRDHTEDRHRHVDDAPFGGGPGMVLQPEPVFEAVEAARAENPSAQVIVTEPWGEPLTQDLARELAEAPGLIIVCGRYEGVDDRVRQALDAREVSIGNYVLSGGELPAMVLIDAVARLVPGVVGDGDSLAQDVFGDGPGGYPQFTRPAEWRGHRVPEVLLSGDHAAISRWRAAHARATKQKIS